MKFIAIFVIENLVKKIQRYLKKYAKIVKKDITIYSHVLTYILFQIMKE